MKAIRNATVAIIAVAATTIGGSAIASDPLEKAIKARKAQMQLYAWNLGQLGAMAKGAVPYDAAAATSAANNLLAVVSLDSMTMWPQGSDSTAMPGKTAAKLESWTTWPAIGEKSQAMNAAATAMAAAAGGGLDSLKGAMGAVGQGCKGCHETYREKKK